VRRALYADFYGFAEEPFNVTPDPKFLFLDETYREALAHLEYGVLYGKGFILLTGEVGTGKTTLLNALLDRLPKEYTTAFIFSTTMSFVELLKMIHEDFGTGFSGDSEAALMIGLNRFLIREYEAGKNAVLVLDEAQNLDVELLEKIRLLSNLEARTSKLMQIVLSGQPELMDKLEQASLRQLNQRIAIRFALTPLNRSETNRYIDHRLTVAESRGLVSFTDEAVDAIFERSRGIPRLVNVICANALLLGFGAGKRKIDRGIIDEVIADLTRTAPRVPVLLGAAGGEAVAPASAASPESAPGSEAVAERGGRPDGNGALASSSRPWTAEEAAAYLRVSVPGVRRLFKSGQIAARRMGRGWRVHREELDRYVRGGPASGAREVASGPEAG
jgi:general secretion pathway protein A